MFWEWFSFWDWPGVIYAIGIPLSFCLFLFLELKDYNPDRLSSKKTAVIIAVIEAIIWPIIAAISLIVLLVSAFDPPRH